MTNVLALGFTVSLILLVACLIKPSVYQKIFRTKMSRKGIGLTLGLASFLLLILVGLTAPKSPPTIEVESETKAAEMPTPKAPEEVLNGICAKYKTNGNCLVSEESGGWYVSYLVETKSDTLMFSSSKQLARDFIFEVYATNLPIKHVGIAIMNYPTGKHYRAGLGKDVASTQPGTTWTDKNIGPTIFYDFLKQHANGSAGDYKDSTYVETNLD